MDNKQTNQGIIEKIEVTEGQTNGKNWTRWTFHMQDGKKYSTFDSVLAEGRKAGDAVEFDTEYDGKYHNLKAMRKSSENTKSDVTTHPIENSNREISIIAQCLTKCVSEQVASNPEKDLKLIEEDVLESYKFFLAKLKVLK